jgi:hypothetical protein
MSVIAADYDNLKKAFVKATPKQIEALRQFCNLVIAPSPPLGSTQDKIINYQKTWNNEINNLESIIPYFNNEQQDAIMGIVNYNNNLNLLPLPQPQPQNQNNIPQNLNAFQKLKAQLLNDFNSLKNDINNEFTKATPEQKNAITAYKEASPGPPPPHGATAQQLQEYQQKVIASAPVMNKALDNMNPVQKALMLKYNQLLKETGTLTNTSRKTTVYILIGILVLILAIIGALIFYKK